MSNVRTTVSGVGSKFPSRVKGSKAALSINTFGMQKLHEGINGEAIAAILLEAAQPAFDQAFAEWPRDTNASVETLELVVYEVGEKNARVALQIGGPALIEDPRNKKHIDYAPFVEFNGTPKTPPGTMTHAIHANEEEIKRRIREGLRVLIEGLLR